jgi:hypothetical protein
MWHTPVWHAPLYVLFITSHTDKLGVRLHFSEVHEFEYFYLRVSPGVAIPGFAPSVPDIAGTLPEFSIKFIL